MDVRHPPGGAHIRKKILPKSKSRLFLRSPINERPVRLSARTSPFHGGKTGSIPVPATIKVAKNQRLAEDLKISRTASRTSRGQRLLEEFKIKYFNMLTSSVYKPAKFYFAHKDT